MSTDKPVEWAITLGVKKEKRNFYTRSVLIKKVTKIFRAQNFDEIIFGIEDYETTGLHVHIYYRGPTIIWMTFNKLWDIGYVKNRHVYDKQGWIKYISKQSDVHHYGEEVHELSIIEQMTGMSIHQYINQRREEGDRFEETLSEGEYYDLKSATDI